MAKFRRLPVSDVTRYKMSEARLGKPKTPEARRKQSETRLKRGYRPTPEHLAKLHAARDAYFASSKKKRAQAKREKKKLEAAKKLALRKKRMLLMWKTDLMTAHKMGNAELFRDIYRSRGWSWRRKIRDVPGVSNGAIPDSFKEKYRGSKRIYGPRGGAKVWIRRVRKARVAPNRER